MTVLSKGEINSSIGYGNLKCGRLEGDDLSIEPASMDVHLGHQMKYPHKEDDGAVVVDDESTYPEHSTVSGNTHTIESGQFVLAHTDEVIDVPASMGCQLHGRSSVGRLGLFIENAGWVDPGFGGQLTLELFNPTDYAIELKTGMRIGQLTFHRLGDEATVGYCEKNGNKYNSQMGATPSRLYEDFE